MDSTQSKIVTPCASQEPVSARRRSAISRTSVGTLGKLQQSSSILRPKHKRMYLRRMDSSLVKPMCGSDEKLGTRGQSTTSRVWCAAGKNGLSKEKSTMVVAPRQKFKPVWLKKPRDLSTTPGPPPPKAGEAWKHQKERGWSCSPGMSSKGKSDRDDSVSAMARTQTQYRPLSRKGRSIANEKLMMCDGTRAAVRVRKCYFDDDPEYIYFHVDDVFFGLKPKGILVPMSLGARTPLADRLVIEDRLVVEVPVVVSTSRPKTPEPVVASFSMAKALDHVHAYPNRQKSPVRDEHVVASSRAKSCERVASSSPATSPESVEAASGRAKSPTMQKKSVQKPLITETSKTSQSQERLYWNSSVILELGDRRARSREKREVSRPKARVAPLKGSEKEEVKEHQRELSETGNQNSLVNAQIAVHIPRPRKRKEPVGSDEDDPAQDTLKGSEEYLSCNGGSKRGGSLPREAKDTN